MKRVLITAAMLFLISAQAEAKFEKRLATEHVSVGAHETAVLESRKLHPQAEIVTRVRVNRTERIPFRAFSLFRWQHHGTGVTVDVLGGLHRPRLRYQVANYSAEPRRVRIRVRRVEAPG